VVEGQTQDKLPGNGCRGSAIPANREP